MLEATPAVLFSHIEKNDAPALLRDIKSGAINPNEWCASDQSPLNYAIRLQYPDIVKILLDSGVSPNTMDNKQVIPLQLAISIAACYKDHKIETAAACQIDSIRVHVNGDYDVNNYIKDQDFNKVRLESFRANIWNYQTMKGTSYTDAVTIVKHLVEHDCAVNTLYSASEVCEDDPFLKISALHHAVMTLQPDVVEALLLSQTVDVDCLTSKGLTALSIASWRRHVKEENDALALKIIKTLIRHGCDVSKGDKIHSTPLRIALQKNDEELCMILFEAAVEVKDVLYCPLCVAISNGCSKAIIEGLINLGCDVNRQLNFSGENVLYFATTNKRCDIVELLLSKGSTFPRTWYQGLAFCDALDEDSSEMVKLFVKHGVNIECLNTSKSSIVHQVVLHNSIQVLNYLIHDTSLDLDQVDLLGKTPLFLAAEFGHLECVKLLVKNGCDIQKRCINLFTVFEGAVLSGNIKCVEFFLCRAPPSNDIISAILCKYNQSNKNIQNWEEIESLLEANAGKFPSLQQLMRENIRMAIGQRNQEEKLRELGVPNCMISYLLYNL